MRRLEIRLDLRKVNILKRLHGFQLHNDLIFTNQVETMPAHFLILKEDLGFALRFVNDPPMAQSHLERALINRLQKPRPEIAMNTNGRLNDLSR
jgi:hypothetical protein